MAAADSLDLVVRNDYAAGVKKERRCACTALRLDDLACASIDRGRRDVRRVSSIAPKRGDEVAVVLLLNNGWWAGEIGECRA